MNETSGLRVSVDVGCYQHSVAFGLSDGTLLAEFELSHEPAGFDRFFERIDRLRERHGSTVSVAMEKITKEKVTKTPTSRDAPVKGSYPSVV